jgi:hypothetical protein
MAQKRKVKKERLSDIRIENERCGGRYVYVGHVNGFARFWRNESRFDAIVEKRVPVNPDNLTLYCVNNYKGKLVNLVFQRYPTIKAMKEALARKNIEFKPTRRSK